MAYLTERPSGTAADIRGKKQGCGCYGIVRVRATVADSQSLALYACALFCLIESGHAE
ncbi:hypothetical protein [Pseudomonas sp. efr-133-TYG-5]|uniref:hypothetical protein n=1 Tax=Pseudomonas sp. efr-133-TYG-5 TaxID=3040310 RepID=UPI0025546B87|nr:hypothetical protein [Pseudomonas sp. efr-133-TYG-5]